MNPIDTFTHYLEHMREMGWRYRLLYTADTIGHWLHLPPWVVCNHFEEMTLGDDSDVTP